MHAAAACRNEAAARSSSAVRCCMQRAAPEEPIAMRAASNVNDASEIKIILGAGRGDYVWETLDGEDGQTGITKTIA